MAELTSPSLSPFGLFDPLKDTENCAFYLSIDVVNILFNILVDKRLFNRVELSSLLLGPAISANCYTRSSVVDRSVCLSVGHVTKSKVFGYGYLGKCDN